MLHDDSLYKSTTLLFLPFQILYLWLLQIEEGFAVLIPTGGSPNPWIPCTLDRNEPRVASVG